MVPGAFPGFDFGPGVRGETTQRLPKLLVQNYTRLPLHGSCCFFSNYTIWIYLYFYCKFVGTFTGKAPGRVIRSG